MHRRPATSQLPAAWDMVAIRLSQGSPVLVKGALIIEPRRIVFSGR